MNFSPGFAEARANGALELVGVVDVQRPAAVLTDVVGHIDERVDGPQANRLQSVLQPLRRGAVRHALDVAGGEHRAGVRRLLGELELHVDRALGGAFDADDARLVLQGAEPRSGEIARDAAHARAVRTVRRQLHFELPGR